MAGKNNLKLTNCALQFSAGFGKRIGLGFTDFCGCRWNFCDYFVDRGQIGLRAFLPMY